MIIVVAGGCANGHPPELSHDGQYPIRQAGSADFSVLTFNTALLPGSNRWAIERLSHIRSALRSAADDIVCVQEAWQYETAQAVGQALRAQHEYLFYTDTRGLGETGEDRCTADDIADLAACTRRLCRHEPAQHVSICVKDRCMKELKAVYFFHPHCFNCLGATLGNDLAEVQRICVESAVGASRLCHGGSGVVMASRWPMENRETILLPASVANRVALLATVRFPGREPIEIACTHLSSGESVPPLHPAFRTWDEERQAQIAQIDAALRRRAGNRPVLLIGDMNAGGARPGWLRAEASASWHDLVSRGFTSPAMEANPPLCSLCSWSTLHTMPGNYLIDHVLLRNSPGGDKLIPRSVAPVFYTPVVLRTPQGDRRSHVSDHFGVRVRFSFQ